MRIMRSIVVLQGQSIWDVAVQHTGYALDAFGIAAANGLSTTGDISAGQVLLVPDGDGYWDDAAEYFAASATKPSTINYYN
jgi:hypothetical protein